MATWACFRVAPGSTGYLALQDVVDVAVKAGGLQHGFRPVPLSHLHAAHAQLSSLQVVNNTQQGVSSYPRRITGPCAAAFISLA